ncbi:MAG: hypothetical protein Kilf2KO_41150 [Rhodospirillales bacterium]
MRFTVEDAQSAEAAFLYLAEVVVQGDMAVPEDPNRFSGQFLTGRATHIELKQDGLSLTGCYSENSGRSFGTIDGSVVDGVALVNWKSDKDIVGTALLMLEALQAAPEMRVPIEGHTDADGSDAYNQDLSARRAASVVAWLKERGIADGRLGSKGRGEGEPVASNKTADGKALNRRVEVSVVR